jgi:hypothetical protein
VDPTDEEKAPPAVSQRKEVKMKMKFSDETLQTFSPRKQQQVIFSLESIVAERVLRISNQQEQFELKTGKFRAVISKVAMEEKAGGETIVTPKLKCVSDVTYPCRLAMPPGVQPYARANSAMIVDVFIQSQQNVVSALVSLLEAPQFPAGLKDMIESNPNTPLRGTIELTGVAGASTHFLISSLPRFLL